MSPDARRKTVLRDWTAKTDFFGASFEVHVHRTTSVNPEPWLWPRPRVLVENADESAAMRLATLLREGGYNVAVCPGPAERERCPLAGPEGCAVAHGADVVVSSLGLDRAERREVLQALRARCPEVPLVVEVGAGQDEKWADLLDGCQLVRSPVVPEELYSAVRRALERVA